MNKNLLTTALFLIFLAGMVSAAPTITILNPENNSTLPSSTTYVDIWISTDEEAVCKYSTTDENFDYWASTNLLSGGGQNWVYHVLHSYYTSMGGTYTFYYKCCTWGGFCFDPLDPSLSGPVQHTFSVAYTLDTTPPAAPVVTDRGDVAYNNLTELSASWTSSDDESGIIEYQYQITQDSPNGNVIRDWTSRERRYSYATASDLNLTDGKTYYFAVKAKNGVGLWGEIGYSDGITVYVDVEPPTTADSGIDGLWHTSPVAVTLTATDAVSGIAKTYYSFDGSDPALVYTGPFTISNNGIYAIKYYSKDNAGNVEPVKTAANQVKIDSSAPSTVNYGIDGLWHNSAVTVRLTAFDLVSGTNITYYSSDGSNPALVYTGPFTISDEGAYTVKYYSIDNVGNVESIKTAGFQVKIDKTLPTGTIKINIDAIYASSTTVILYFSASDAASGVSEMQLSNDNITYASPRSYSTSIIWTLTAGDGTKTVYVKYKDAAGNWSVAYSDSIILETSAPTKPVVADGGATTKSKNTLSASWSSSDPESGIVEYQYIITQNSPYPTGAIIGSGWTSTGTNNYVTATGLKLRVNKTYYFGVQAKNGIGLWSEIGYSDGIKVQ